MRFFVVLAVLCLSAACSNTSSGGGGGVYYAADVKGCDAKTASGCIGFNGTDTKTGDGDATATDNDVVGTDGDAVGNDGSGTDDTASGDDVGALDGFFDDPDSTVVPDGGPLNSDCNERAKIVYVVTEQNDLLSFQPDTLTFKLVGKL